ncbi:TetR/AcrR family transcriptional regulator [Mycolicibacterium sp. YH-1]|uniref:TetR/AcrR family transcriptional regulator n=1 Tax=Mycolicibacterium sp. YH-1 TaxID=2908837 RepID=UPI001F4BF7ED|nr:TetR/AcrR family transcriptional regulator [Mycolicibacterium sp. YH-1]UNB50804.1 TetR/AcrR family transcriptional regulator [Mycolicibacterium sp. YH-1]
MNAPSVEGGLRARTRRAIIDAAVDVLARNPAASLSDIAAAAEVGRSTLHRYFPERTELVRSLALHVHALGNAAIAQAEPDSGPPIAALRRVVESQLELGPIVLYMYTEPVVSADSLLRARLETGDEVIADLLQNVAKAPGVPPPGWSRRVFWSLLHAGYQAAQEDRTPKRRIIDAIMATLTEGAIRADASGDPLHVKN